MIQKHIQFTVHINPSIPKLSSLSLSQTHHLYFYFPSMESGFPPRGHPGFRFSSSGFSTNLYNSDSSNGSRFRNTEYPTVSKADIPAIAATPGLLKRQLNVIENHQHQLQYQQQLQMQLQHALFLRSVKQRTMQMASPVSPLSPPFDMQNTRNLPLPPAVNSRDSEKSMSMQNQLQELERQLLFDEDDDDNTANNKVLVANQSSAINTLSSSPTNSSTSTTTSVASCSPASSCFAKQILIDTAAAISEGNSAIVAANLQALKRAANPGGDPEQRLTAIMLAPLIFRVNNMSSSSSLSNSGLCSPEHFVSTQLLYNFSPCFKLALIAAGYAILDVTRNYSKIHILDFEFSQGCHYAALFKALAESRFPLPSVRITAVTDPSSPFTNTNSAKLRSVGDRIEKLGENQRIVVKFNIVSLRPSEITPGSLRLDPGEALVVNFPFVLSRVPDESVSPANPRDQLIRMVRGLKPSVIVLVEQELNTNTAPFASRFTEACSHFGAILESLDGLVDRDAVERTQVEAGLARRAVNSVAREGSDRVERCEVFGKWRARMGMAGLQPIPIGPNVVEPIKCRFATAVQCNPGFTIKEDFGGVGVGFGWRDRVLTVASAWH